VLEQLLKSGEHTGRRRMKRLMAESFSRMGGIFNALLEDHYLGAEQRDLIGHLYLPMLKLGMLDGRFWTDPHHVGRRLFGVFCELAEFWVSAAQGDRTTYPQLHRAAECLTRDYIDDIAVVEAVFDELEAFAARIGQRANLTLNRTVEAERGMAKVGSAQTFAAEQAATMLSDEALPAVIRDSMQLPLTEFLSGLLLRYQSESGEKALAATGAIMAKALPKGDTPPQQGLADVSHDLMTAGGHTAAVQALVDAVQQALQRWQGLEGLSGKQAQAAVLAHGRKSSGAGPLAGLPGQGFGLWFAVEEREQPTPRLWLLVWASPAPRRYLFVNRLGVRGDMLDEGALREALDQGRLRPLVGHGNSWVRALRQAASQPGQ
jgi:hypothetical protein